MICHKVENTTQAIVKPWYEFGKLKLNHQKYIYMEKENTYL